MSEAMCITKAREHCAKFQSLKLEDTSTVFLQDGDGTVWRVSQLLAEYDVAIKRAEAAEAERDHYMKVGIKRLDSIVALEEEYEALGRRLSSAQMEAEAEHRACERVIAERDSLRKDAEMFLAYVERQQCLHEETHRGGAIWEICDTCGSKWADDEGGKPTQSEPKEITRFRAALTASSPALAVQP